MGTSSTCRTWRTGCHPGNIRVAKDDVGYYLSAAVIDNPPEGKTFYKAAQDLLPLVNGIGSLKSAKFRPVRLDGQYQEGEKRHTVIGVSTIETRSRVHSVGIVTGPDRRVKPQPPSPGIAYAALTARPEVAEALTILATPAGGWVELYKVFEIIRDALKPIALDKSGWRPRTRSARSRVRPTDPMSVAVLPGTHGSAAARPGGR